MAPRGKRYSRRRRRSSLRFVRTGKGMSTQWQRTISSKIHMFKRTYQLNYGLTDTFGHYAMGIMLNLVPNPTEFTTLFDQYRICAVRCKFIYDCNVATAIAVAGAHTQFIPNLVTVNDYDDATVLVNMDGYMQYETFKINRLDKPVVRYFKPKLATVVYAGGAFSGYAQDPSKIWIDANTTNAPYYGLKFGVDGAIEGGAGTLPIGTLRIYVTYYLECRDTR